MFIVGREAQSRSHSPFSSSLILVPRITRLYLHVTGKTTRSGDEPRSFERTRSPTPTFLVYVMQTIGQWNTDMILKSLFSPNSGQSSKFTLNLKNGPMRACFLALREPWLVRFCVVVCELFRVFSIFFMIAPVLHAKEHPNLVRKFVLALS